MPVPPGWLLVGTAAAFNVVAGFNDGGNLLGSLVGARAFTLLGAALLLAAGAALGPWVVGTAVAHTIIFSVVALPQLGRGVYLAAICGALAAVGVSWWRALPTSTSLALVGALAGAGLAADGPRAVVWHALWKVFAAMLLALVAGALAGGLVWTGVRLALRRAGPGAPTVLRSLQGLTGMLQGFGYGSNDAEKAMGLFALAGAWAGGASPTHTLPIPAWAVWSAIGTFGLGMALGGARILRTVGFRLYPVRARDALSAQLAAGMTVVLAAAAGAPVSSTQTTTSALLAAGAARRLSLPRWAVVRHMALTWVVTLPLGLCAGFVLLWVGRAL